MTLQLCADLSPATWIAESELPWNRLVAMGPSGFAAYARLRFIPDPAYPGQSENDVEVSGDLLCEHDRLCAVLEVLRAHTETPDEVCYCIWDGWGWTPRADESAPDRPGLVHVGEGQRVADPPVSIHPRSYHLMRGTLSDFGAWGLPDPAFVWPADHAWCVAKDVDPHYAGIGASPAAIAQLVETPGLDVVPADPEAEQPFYR